MKRRSSRDAHHLVWFPDLGTRGSPPPPSGCLRHGEDKTSLQDEKAACVHLLNGQILGRVPAKLHRGCSAGTGVARFFHVSWLPRDSAWKMCSAVPAEELPGLKPQVSTPVSSWGARSPRGLPLWVWPRPILTTLCCAHFTDQDTEAQKGRVGGSKVTWEQV